MNFIVYGLSALSLFIIIVTIYLVPSDVEIIPIQTPLEEKTAFLEECISENKDSVNLNKTTPNQFCTDMYKIQG